ncbi:MAG: hypothetical protein QOF70_6183 [Acetobacteraceae bacterium]|nr:hypothetical protein [Acetobacteraceae bacterium]
MGVDALAAERAKCPCSQPLCDVPLATERFRASQGSLGLLRSEATGSQPRSNQRLVAAHGRSDERALAVMPFSVAMLIFWREDVPANWREWCDQVTDNFRVVNPTEFRIIGRAGYIMNRRRTGQDAPFRIPADCQLVFIEGISAMPG